MKYADLADLPEDERIEIIGRQVMGERKTGGIVVDNEPEKVARYQQKLRDRFPGIIINDPVAGPVPNTVTIRVEPPAKRYTARDVFRRHFRRR